MQSIEINNKKEILLVVPDKYEFVIIFSNNTNIKSLRTFKIQKFDSSYISNPYFSVRRFASAILPSEIPSQIIFFFSFLKIKYFNKDYSFKNFLYRYFNDIESTNNIWFFQNNEDTCH